MKQLHFFFNVDEAGLFKVASTLWTFSFALRHWRTCVATAIIMASTTPVIAQLQITPSRLYSWSEPVDGLWLESNLWDGIGYPSYPSDTALINIPGKYAIEIQEDTEISVLELWNPSATVILSKRTIFTVNRGLFNNGSILINPDGDRSTASLRLDSDLYLAGTGRIQLGAVVDWNDAQIIADDQTIEIGTDYVIEGAGRLRGTFINHGRITAHSESNTSLFIGGSVIQSDLGVMEAINSPVEIGGFTRIVGGTLRLHPDATLVLYQDADISQTQLEMESSVLVQIGGDLDYPFYDRQVDRVEVIGYLGIGAELSINQSYDFNGEFVLGVGNTNRSGARLRFGADNVHLGGNGKIIMNRPQNINNTNHIYTGGDFDVSFGPDVVFEGQGRFSTTQGGSMSFEGVIRTADAQDKIYLEGDINGGTFEAHRGLIRIGGEGVISSASFSATESGRVELAGRPILENVAFGNGTDLIFYYSAVPTFRGLLLINGDIVLNRTGGGMIFENPVLFGSGEIIMRRERPGVINSLSGELVLPSSFTIRGSGQINANLINNSVVIADDELFPLTIYGDTSGGDFVAVDSGVMQLRGEHRDGYFTTDGGVVEIIGADISNSQLVAGASGEIQLVPNAQLTLHDSYAMFDMELLDRATVRLFGQTELHGHHTLEGEAVISLQTQDFTGVGSFRLIDDPDDPEVPTIHVSYANVGFGPNYIIRGSGAIDGPIFGGFQVDGELIADDPVSPMRLGGVIGPVAQLLADGAFFHLMDGLELKSSELNSINGGAYVSEDEGVVKLRAVINRSDLILRGDLQVMLLDDFVNDGQITIGYSENRSGIVVSALAPLTISGTGTITLESRLMDEPSTLLGQPAITIGQGQTIVGSGHLAGNIILDGTIAPNTEAGPFTVSQLEMSASAELRLDIGDASMSANERLSINQGGGIALAGTLSLALIDGVTPSLGDRWIIADPGDHSGEFGLITMSGIDLGAMVFDTFVTPQGLELVLTCPGDRNGDTIRDFFDISDFIADFNANDPNADLNHDGIWDFFDVTSYISQFIAECSP